MKLTKMVSLLLCMTMLLTFSSFSAGEEKTEENDVRFDIYKADGGFMILSQIMPNVAVQVDSLLPMNPELTIPIIRTLGDSLYLWAKDSGSVTEKGLFTGDAFSCAKTRNSFTVTKETSDSFLGLFSEHRTELQYSELLSDLFSVAFENPDLWITGAVYNEGSFFSISIMNHQDCVQTFSADISQKDSVYLVIGQGNGSSSYFHEIFMDKKDRSTELEYYLFNGSKPVFRLQSLTMLQMLHISFVREEEYWTFSGLLDSSIMMDTLSLSGFIHEDNADPVGGTYIRIPAEQFLQMYSVFLGFEEGFPILEMTEEQTSLP